MVQVSGMKGYFDPHVCFLDGKVAGDLGGPVLELPVPQILEVLVASSHGRPSASATQRWEAIL